MNTTSMLGWTAVIVMGVAGLKNTAGAATVTGIPNPYSDFGVGELQNAKFIGVNTPNDGFNVDMYDLQIELGGIKAFGSGGKPFIRQAGFSGPLTGTTVLGKEAVLLWDGGVLTYDNGTLLGTNVILMQSLAATGDTFDMALVFDIEEITSFPVSGELTKVFLVSDPESGSFTMDSAIAAAAEGPTVPEPSSTLLLGLGFMALLGRRKIDR